MYVCTLSPTAFLRAWPPCGPPVRWVFPCSLRSGKLLEQVLAHLARVVAYHIIEITLFCVPTLPVLPSVINQRFCTFGVPGPSHNTWHGKTLHIRNYKIGVLFGDRPPGLSGLVAFGVIGKHCQVSTQLAFVVSRHGVHIKHPRLMR